MNRLRLWPLALLACLALTAFAGATASASGPAAGAAKSCSTPKYPGVGYFTSLKVTGLSCSSGKKVMMAHYRCRTKHGKTGKCTSKVSGYSCTEKRNNSSPIEYDARVTCKKGSKKVVYTYQQDK